jgi:hypothetical protein
MTAESGLSKPDWHTGLSKRVQKDDDSGLRIKQAGVAYRIKEAGTCG